MNERVFLVSPVAPAGGSDKDAAQATQAGGAARRLGAGKPLRLGLLDNGKFNAAALLEGIAARLQAHMPIAGVTRERKSSMSSAATEEALDRLAREADLVISAMAD